MSKTTLAKTTTVAASDYKTSSDFEGWYLGTAPSPVTCTNHWTWVTSGSYGGCYDPTSSITYLPTKCIGSTGILIGTDTRVCATSASCDSFKLFPTEGAADSDAVTIIECLQNWPANSIYRQLPARYAASTTASFTNTPATATSTATPTSTQGSTNSDDSNDSISGGAIAGIVVGCVAGVAILALIFFFRKRLLAACGYSKAKPADDGGPSWSPVYAPAQTASETQGSSVPPPSEIMSNEKAVHEAAGNTVHEAAGSNLPAGHDGKATYVPDRSGQVHELG